MYKRILVPIDGSATAERGLREALALAGSHKACLCLLHVVDEYPQVLELSSATNHAQTRRANEWMSGLREEGEALLARAAADAKALGIDAETRQREVSGGRIADVVVEEVAHWKCDLIVMGTHGRRGFSRMMLGSDAEMVVRTSPVPVLLVREPAASP